MREELVARGFVNSHGFVEITTEVNGHIWMGRLLTTICTKCADGRWLVEIFGREKFTMGIVVHGKFISFYDPVDLDVLIEKWSLREVQK